MRIVLLAALALLLSACSNESEGESAEDFAARVGAGQDAAAADPATQESVPVQAAPPAGVDVKALEQLGNIAGADLGPRDGGCTFAASGRELMLAGAPNDPATSGKAVVRIAGTLYLLNAPTGGMPAIRRGGRFTGEGVIVIVRPSGPQTADLEVTDAAGSAAHAPGSWICA